MLSREHLMQALRNYLLSSGFVCLVWAGPVLGQVNLPDIGEAAGGTLSSTEEQRIGKAFIRDIRLYLPVINDAEITDYVESLGYRLVSNSDNAGQPFQFLVILDPVINAFAGFGGVLGIHTGLIVASRSESELASVLAHEIAHVTQRHLARSLENAGNTSLVSMAGVLAGILAGAAGGADAGMAVGAGVQAAKIQNRIDFTRENEKEADRVGMQVLVRSDFDPRAMPMFFEQLQESYRYYKQPPEFLSTHPVTISRIADSRSRAEQYPHKQYADSVAFYLVKAKLHVITEKNPAEAVAYFKEALASGQTPNPLGTRYGYALALMKAGRLDAARDQLDQLLKEDPDRIPFHGARAQVAVAANNIDEGLYIYSDILELFPNDKLLTRGYGRTLLHAGQPQKALDVLTEYTRVQPPDIVVYRLLAEANGALGNNVAARAALAEHYFLLGELDAAIGQLELAKREPSEDFYRMAQIDARLQELQQEKELSQIR